MILRVFKDTQLIEVKQFDAAQVVIGHDADVQLDLQGEGVSAIHCMIELRDAGYYVCDLGSQTGTFKNGQAVLDESLASGDEIRIGPYRLVFYVGVPKPTAAPVPSVSMPEPTKAVEAPIVAPTVDKKVAGTPIPSRPDPVVVISPVKATKPEIRRTVGAFPTKARKATFAPKSEITDLKNTLQPGKGNVVEVVVAWRERVIDTHHFVANGVYRLGPGPRDQIRVTAASVVGSWNLVEMNNGVRVNVSEAMNFEVSSTTQGNRKIEECLTSGKATRYATGVSVRLDQGEMICLGLGEINLFVRFAPQSGIVPMLPALGLTGTELSGVVLSVVLTALLAFYISATTPKDLNEAQPEQITRTAQVIFNTPPPKPPTTEPPPPPPPQVSAPTTTTAPTPTKVKVTEDAHEKQNKGAKDSNQKAQAAQTAGRAVEVAPIPNSENKPKKFTSTKSGGAVKIGEKAGANAKSAKDMSKIGLFSAFGGGGVRTKLDQAYSGAGEVLGQADKATGSTGFGENRAGDDLGSKFKDTGAGGKGTATQGISGIGTKGRSSGQSAYGAVDGMGGKSAVAIESGGAEEDFVGTIDKEAVRRVVKHYLNEIRGCYVRELSKLEKGKKLEGKVVVSWEIAAQGVARNVKIKSSSLNSPVIESCIRERLASWIFPNPPAGTVAEVSYPFLLSQGQ